MSGKEILVDTNIIIYLLQGDDTLQEMLQGKLIHVSFITELELYGLHKRTKEYERQVDSLLNDCSIISMNNKILQQYKLIRKSYKLKLADSLVVATALSMKIPLVTADAEFNKVKALKLVHYQK